MADLLFNATRDAERVFKPLVTALKLQAPEPLKLKPPGATPPQLSPTCRSHPASRKPSVKPKSRKNESNPIS